jgi:hypothetical protein
MTVKNVVDVLYTNTSSWKATETELHPNTSREDVFSLSRPWKPVIRSLKGRNKKFLSLDQ